MTPPKHQRPQLSRRWPNRLTGVTLVCAAALLILPAWNEMQALALTKSPSIKLDTASLPQNSSASLYEAYADAALRNAPQNLTLARQATMKALAMEPANVSAWNRLVFLDIAEDGQLSREGVAAFQKSYALAPYGDLGLMTWRVDFASQIWPALPDFLQTATLQQIPVIAEFGTSWEWRIRHCRENPNEKIALAICAVSPGVVRPASTQ